MKMGWSFVFRLIKINLDEIKMKFRPILEENKMKNLDTNKINLDRV